MKQHILIVEDEASIATLITYNLEQAGYETTVAKDGEQGLHLIEEQSFDFIVLDLMLPAIDGMEVCRRIRKRGNEIPILMLTAKSDEADKVSGLQSGADDYLTKPFSPKELIARIEAILRRTRREASTNKNYISIGALKVFPNKFQAFLHNKPLDLTKKECEVLIYLAEHKGEIISRDQLLHQVWGYDYTGDTRTVDMQVSRLRDKIEQDSKEPQYIKTVWGIGYRMEEPS